MPLFPDQRGSAHSGGGHRGALLGHRYRVHRGLRLPGFPRRPDVLCRHGGPCEYPESDARFRQRLSTGRLGARAAPATARSREPWICQLGKVAHDRRRRRLHRPHGTREVLARRTQHDASRHLCRARVAPRHGAGAHRSGRSRGRSGRRHIPRGRGRCERRASSGDCAPAARSRRRACPSIDSAPRDCRPSRSPRNGSWRAKARSTRRAVWNRSRCVQNEANQRMLKEQWVVEHKPEVYWNMLQTAETVAKRYGISRQAAGRVRCSQPAARRRGGAGRTLQRRNRALRDHHGGGRQGGGHHRYLKQVTLARR